MINVIPAENRAMAASYFNRLYVCRTTSSECGLAGLSVIPHAHCKFMCDT